MKRLAGILLLLIPSHVCAQSGPPFLTQWSFPGGKVDDIEVSPSGNLIAVGSGYGAEFTPDGVSVRTLTMPPPTYYANNSLALLPDGSMVIIGSPSGTTGFCYFMKNGIAIRIWNSQADGKPLFPQACESDNAGNILTFGLYGSTAIPFTVSTWDTTGTRLSGFGAEGSTHGYFKGYGDIAVDAVGNIFVVDSGNYRVEKFSAGGTVLGSFGSQGDGFGQFLQPWGIAVDGTHGYIYVTDLSLHRINMFTVSGLPVAKWGAPGSGAEQFYFPSAVAVGLDGRVFVADTGNGRIQAFGYLQASVPVANVTWGKLKTMYTEGDTKTRLR